MDVIIGQVQNISFGEVGATYHSGIAERSTKIIHHMANKMMIHVAISTPEGFITTYLWTTKMGSECLIYNKAPKQSNGLSPYEAWTRSTYTPNKYLFRNFHVFCAPTNVLETKLQNSIVKIPIWKPIITRTAFMRFSYTHSTKTSLVLNMKTKSTPPQFHVVFDDGFIYIH